MSEAPHKRQKIALVSAGLLLVLGLACAQRKGPPLESEKDAAAASPTLARIEELSRISARNDVDAVGAGDIGHREVALRRAAARALARMNDVRATPKLFSLLSDEDPEVIAFAAHGLGALAGEEGADGKMIVGALVTRSVSLPPRGGSLYDPAEALVRALGRFDLEQVEPTLVAWLELPAPWKASSAFALGEVASRTKALAATTQEALLLAAEAEADPLEEALFAFGRLDRIETKLRPRVYQAARARLERRGPARLFAIRALGRTGSEAAGDLERVLLSEDDFDRSERAEAARALARLGADGERALAKALADFMPAEEPLRFLDGATYGPWLATVEALRGSLAISRERLKALATMPTPERSSVLRERLLARLRCAALPKLSAAALPDELVARCHHSAETTAPEAAPIEVEAPPLSKPVKLVVVTDMGSVSLVLDPRHAPVAAARFAALARMGHYDGAKIPLVAYSLFAQIAGAPDKPPASPLPRETAPIAFGPLTVGVALDEGLETGSDKLFVTLGRHPELDGQYAFLGQADESFMRLDEGALIERVLVEEL